ncbi:MAG TPA: hypothetical protein VFX76_07280, partial [Roseiflexaceae bacterium]|nr:hypothetical protein [Roseiflexaceae bacterium]
MANPTPILPAIDRSQLKAWVRRATEYDQAEIVDWQAALIHGGATTNARVYCLAGRASVDERELDWSLVLKEWRQRDANVDPTALGYWKREALAYQAGWLASHTSGLRSPRCFGVFEQDAATIWLALEDIKAPQP